MSTFKTKWEKKQAAARAAAETSAPAAPAECPAEVSVKEALLATAAKIRAVAVRIPTFGVVDSNLHHDLLQAEVRVIEKIAESL